MHRRHAHCVMAGLRQGESSVCFMLLGRDLESYFTRGSSCACALVAVLQNVHALPPGRTNRAAGWNKESILDCYTSIRP